MSGRLRDGADLSKWQKTINWRRAHPRLGFVMLKATEGVSELDGQYRRNLAAARKANLPTGSYHYPNAGHPGYEATYYVRHADHHQGELLALDFEGKILDDSDPVSWAHDFLARARALTGVVPLIYMSESTVGRWDWSRVVKLGAPLWAAAWGQTDPPGHGQWPALTMWQRTNKGRVRGVRGNVDRDVFYGDLARWLELGGKSAAPRPVAPSSSEPAPAHKTAAVHVVAAGDTLTSIAHAARVTVGDLVEWNRAAYPSLGWNRDLIDVGWRLRVG